MKTTATTTATIIVTLLITMMVVMSMGCAKEQQVIYPDGCTINNTLGYSDAKNERSSSQEGVVTFMHVGEHQYQGHDGFEWQPLHDGWISGCVSVSLGLLTPRTHCDNQYSALRVLRKSGHGISEGRRWFVSGVEQERQSLGMDCVTVYVFDEEGRPINSNCTL